MPQSTPGIFQQSEGIFTDDGFTRAALSNVILEQGFEYGIPRSWETVLVNGGTVTLDANQRSLILNVGVAAGARAMVQTRHGARWRWGHTITLFMALVPNYLGTVLTGATKIRMGFFDDFNGQFFELNAAGMWNVFRSSASGSLVEIAIPQTSWNPDKLDGLGPSRFNADWSKAQRMFISATSPGAGRGRAGVFFRDRYINASQISSVNTRSSIPFLQTVALPVRVEIINDGGTGSGASNEFYSCSMIEEGPSSVAETGFITTAGTGVTSVVAGSAGLVPLFSVRKVDTKAGFRMRGHIIPSVLKFLNQSQTIPGYFQLLENATLTGASFSPIDVDNSITELDTSATALSGGVKIDEGYIDVGKGTSLNIPTYPSKIFLSRSYANVRDTLTVAVRGIGGTADISGLMTLRELY